MVTLVVARKEAENISSTYSPFAEQVENYFRPSLGRETRSFKRIDVKTWPRGRITYQQGVQLSLRNNRPKCSLDVDINNLINLININTK
jgi:hypothetical protein